MAYSHHYLSLLHQINNPPPPPSPAPKKVNKTTKKVKINEEEIQPMVEEKTVDEVPHMDEEPPKPQKKKKITIIKQVNKPAPNKKDDNLEEDTHG